MCSYHGVLQRDLPTSSRASVPRPANEIFDLSNKPIAEAFLFLESNDTLKLARKRASCQTWKKVSLRVRLRGDKRLFSGKKCPL